MWEPSDSPATVTILVVDDYGVHSMDSQALVIDSIMMLAC